jgi:hypothetical protein
VTPTLLVKVAVFPLGRKLLSVAVQLSVVAELLTVIVSVPVPCSTALRQAWA